jgi:small-conductance mechanosensitive channel
MDQNAIHSMVWTAIVAVGYPALVVALLEMRRMLKPHFEQAASLCTLVQLTILPLAAGYVLLVPVAGYSADDDLPKLLLSALVVAAINIVLTAIKFAVRSGFVEADWARRVPALVLDIVRLVIVLMAAAFVASSIWNVDLGAVMTALGVGSVVLGLALQDTLSGLFAGVSLMSGRHFKEGDWIESGEISGRIVKMDWRSVTVLTLDDERLVVIPNSSLAKEPFTILGTTALPYGQKLKISFSYTTPPARAIEALAQGLDAVPDILQEGRDIDIIAYTETGIDYEVTFHCVTREQGDDSLTDYFRKIWYIAQREGLQFSGDANRLFRGRSLPRPSRATLTTSLEATQVFPQQSPGFDRLLDAAVVELYDRNERLQAADAAFRRLYLVLKGSLAVQQTSGGKTSVVQAVGPGEFFVNRAYLTGAEAGLDIRADTETEVLSLQAQDVLEFLNGNPDLARRFEQAIDLTDRSLDAQALSLDL